MSPLPPPFNGVQFILYHKVNRVAGEQEEDKRWKNKNINKLSHKQTKERAKKTPQNPPNPILPQEIEAL